MNIRTGDLDISLVLNSLNKLSEAILSMTAFSFF